MSIVCVGQSAFDITMPVHEPILDNKKYRIEEEYQCGGGPALNAACLCSLWGENVQLVSKIGKDAYGQKLLELIHQYGVRDDHLQIVDGLTTPYSYIFVNSNTGNRTIFNHPAINREVVYSTEMSSVDVILSDGHEPDISIQLIQKYPNARSVIDAGSCRETTMAVAKYVDDLVCSKDFAEQYTGEQLHLTDWDNCVCIFRKVQQINHGNTVITLGEDGLLYEENGEIKHLPAFKVKAVDTTGAGDIFHGAFAYGIATGMSLYENLRQSSMASAISVQTIGGQRSIPTLETVRDNLKRQK